MSTTLTQAPWAQPEAPRQKKPLTWLGYLGVILMLPGTLHCIISLLAIGTGLSWATDYFTLVDGGWGFSLPMALVAVFPGYLLTVVSMLTGARRPLFLTMALLPNILVILCLFVALAPMGLRLLLLF